MVLLEENLEQEGSFRKCKQGGGGGSLWTAVEVCCGYSLLFKLVGGTCLGVLVGILMSFSFRVRSRQILALPRQ